MPVCELMLGCQIRVTNLTLGGVKGYDCGMLISSLNVPPSKGESGGLDFLKIKYNDDDVSIFKRTRQQN